MFCTSCGGEVPHGSRFCVKCGAPLKLAEALETAPDRGDPDFLEPSSPSRSGTNRLVWVGMIVVPLVVICSLLAMVGAMKPSEKKTPEFLSPRQISFSGTAPESARLGLPVEFKYEVSNSGTAEFKDFRLAFPESFDKSFDISSVRPEAKLSVEEGKRIISLGNLGVGQRLTVALMLMPKAEGEQEVKVYFFDGSVPLTSERGDGMVYKKVKVSP